MNTTVLNVMLSSNISAQADTSDQESNSDSSMFSDELQKAKSQAQSQSTDSTSDKKLIQTHPRRKSIRLPGSPQSLRQTPRFRPNQQVIPSPLKILSRRRSRQNQRQDFGDQICHKLSDRQKRI